MIADGHMVSQRTAPRPPGTVLRVVLGILTVVLAVVALGLAALTIGALASLNANVPPLLGAASAAETLISGRLHLALDAFWRAMSWAGLCCLSVWLAAYIKPRF
jgi:hypothetical protein